MYSNNSAKITSDTKKGTVTATKSKSTIVLTLNKNIAVLNGKAVDMTSTTQTINKVTMVPLDFVGTALVATTKYDEQTNTASITVKQIVHGITVDYGKHHYESKNQKEYNDVMVIINKAIKENEQKSFESLNEYGAYFTEYLNGARWDGNVDSLKDKRQEGLYFAEMNFRELTQANVKKEDIMKAYRAHIVAKDLIRGIKDPDTDLPRTAHDALIKRTSDCDSDAQVYSAVYDFFWFSTAIFYGPGHAEMVFQINGKWVNPYNGEFNIADFKYYVSEGLTVHTQPTNGDIINPNGTTTKKK